MVEKDKAKEQVKAQAAEIKETAAAEQVVKEAGAKVIKEAVVDVQVARATAAVEQAKAPKTWAASWNRKSYKREASVAMTVFWMILTVKVFFFATPELIAALNMVYSTVTTLIGAIIMAAFGLDAYAKQIMRAPPTE